MKKLLITISVFSLFLFSGCGLFSAKDSANQEIKANENIETQQEVKGDDQVLPQTEAQNESTETKAGEETTDEPQAVTSESEEVKLAKCLTEKGAKLYTSSTCPHCKDQKELFKEGLQYLDNTECLAADGWAQVCKDIEINAVPTWIFADGQRLTGTTPLEVLAEKTGCGYIPAAAGV